MADAWNPATSYSPNAIVTYNGQTYIRSQYPVTATAGTPPNLETGVDGNGDEIRTWTLHVEGYYGYQPKFLTVYFRIIEPTEDPDTGVRDFFYSGGQFYASNAYAPIGDPSTYIHGGTVERDQFKSNPLGVPDSPVCPKEYCGLAMQQFQENGQVACDVADIPDDTNPLKRYIFVIFNHPLYFRRTIKVFTQIGKTVTVYDPYSSTTTYENTFTNYLPDDRNYVTNTPLTSYYIPENAAFEVTVPPNVYSASGSTEYAFTRRDRKSVV
jgi:hypothetical protein